MLDLILQYTLGFFIAAAIILGIRLYHNVKSEVDYKGNDVYLSGSDNE